MNLKFPQSQTRKSIRRFPLMCAFSHVSKWEVAVNASVIVKKEVFEWKEWVLETGILNFTITV